MQNLVELAFPRTFNFRPMPQLVHLTSLIMGHYPALDLEILKALPNLAKLEVATDPDVHYFEFPVGSHGAHDIRVAQNLTHFIFRGNMGAHTPLLLPAALRNLELQLLFTGNIAWLELGSALGACKGAPPSFLLCGSVCLFVPRRAS